jgi:hypothetical protein
MILQNKLLTASTLNRAISLIASDFGDYRKVQLRATRRKITIESFVNQRGNIEPQSNQ